MSDVTSSTASDAGPLYPVGPNQCGMGHLCSGTSQDDGAQGAEALGLPASGAIVSARQGHAYRYRNGNGKVIALTSGELPRVGFVKDGGFARTCVVSARDLVPIPMAYFHGEVPK